MSGTTRRILVALLALLLPPLAGLVHWAGVQAEEIRINVQADQVIHHVSRLLTGACIEDVNHEIYGCLYSQMIFGESFQEPAAPPPQFKAYGDAWKLNNGELIGGEGNWPKLVSELPAFGNGEAGVEIFFADRERGRATLVSDSPTSNS